MFISGARNDLVRSTFRKSSTWDFQLKKQRKSRDNFCVFHAPDCIADISWTNSAFPKRFFLLEYTISRLQITLKIFAGWVSTKFKEHQNPNPGTIFMDFGVFFHAEIHLFLVFEDLNQKSATVVLLQTLLCIFCGNAHVLALLDSSQKNFLGHFLGCAGISPPKNEISYLERNQKSIRTNQWL